MKTQILTCLAAGILLGAVPSQGKDVRSPDGQFAVRAESAISLVNSSGALILTLVRDTTGDAKVEVAWSPDSRHVVVVENGERVGSGIVCYRNADYPEWVDIIVVNDGISVDLFVGEPAYLQEASDGRRCAGISWRLPFPTTPVKRVPISPTSRLTRLRSDAPEPSVSAPCASS